MKMCISTLYREQVYWLYNFKRCWAQGILTEVYKVHVFHTKHIQLNFLKTENHLA